MTENNNVIKIVNFKSKIKMFIKSKKMHNIFPESGIIFIHIPKTGGISINNFLSSLKDDNITYENKKKYYFYEELRRLKIASIHGKARDYIKFIDNRLWNRSLKITSIRNPWDLMVSSYYWWLQEGFKFPRCRHMYNDISTMNFNEFITSSYGTNMINDCVGNIEDWIYDHNGKLLLDGLIRLENFEEDFQTLISKFDLKINGLKSLPKLNSTSHKKYQDHYNENTKKIIEKRFDYLIKNYDYKFE